MPGAALTLGVIQISPFKGAMDKGGVRPKAWRYITVPRQGKREKASPFDTQAQADGEKRPAGAPAYVSFTAMMPLHKKRLPAFRAMRAPAAKAAEGRLSDGWQTPPLGQGCIMTKTSRPVFPSDGRF